MNPLLPAAIGASSSGIFQRLRPSVSVKRKYLHQSLSNVSLRTPEPTRQNPFALPAINQPTAPVFTKTLIDSEKIPTRMTLPSTNEVLKMHFPEKELPPLPKVSDPMFEKALADKLMICSEVLDFSNASIQVREKEMKEAVFCELIHLFYSQEIVNCNSKIQRAIFRMLERNIFREDPIFPTREQTIDYIMTVQEPSWPHLFYCYQMLNMFMRIFPNAEFVNLNVIHRAIHLFQLPDINERNQMILFVKCFLDQRPNEAENVMRLLEAKLQELISGIATPYCGMPIFSVLAHIFQNSPTVTPMHTRILRYSVLPALALPYLSSYHTTIRQFFNILIGRSRTSAIWVLRQIEHMWPQTSAPKQILLFDLMILIFTRMAKEDFGQIAVPVFQFFAGLVNSQYGKLSEQVLDIWIKQPVDEWLVASSRYAVREMYEAVNQAAKNHWCLVNREKAAAALQEMIKVNKAQFHKMKTAEKQAKESPVKHAPKTTNSYIKKWTFVAKKAYRNGYDDGPALTETTKIIQQRFSVETEEKREISRFANDLSISEGKAMVSEMFLVPPPRDLFNMCL